MNDQLTAQAQEDREQAATIRALGFIAEIVEAQANRVAAERAMHDAQVRARAAGVTSQEISMAIAMFNSRKIPA